MGQDPEGAGSYVPDVRDLSALWDAVQECRGCGLYRDATQGVLGDGARAAEVMFIGEQPGDREDIEGAPFVGPAGRELDRGLEAAGIPRGDVFVTNVVKHFKFTTRGKRRLHETPNRDEIDACRPWLDAEIDTVGPQVLVALGATAAKSLLGSGFRVTRQHGELHPGPKGTAVTATLHPSAILRAPTDEDRHDTREVFTEDLEKVAAIIAGGLKAGLLLETKAALYTRAQELDIGGRSSMSKGELADAVAAAWNGGRAS